MPATVEAEPTMMKRSNGAATPILPLVSFGREVCGDVNAGLRREWLVTNGIGGYASGSLAGPKTRGYHGYLVAALEPPVGRTVLVGDMTEWATYHGHKFPLSAHEWRGGGIEPPGYQHLESFVLEGALPVWTYAVGDALIEKRVWLAHGQNTVYIMYRAARATAPIELELTPLVTYRDFHALKSGDGWRPEVKSCTHGARITAHPGARQFRLLADGGRFEPTGDWYWGFHHREEQARGLRSESDLFAPGIFRARLCPGERVTLVFTAETEVDVNGPRQLALAEARQLDLVQRADVETAHPVVRQLVLAADQFIVARSNAADPMADSKSIIAGYHWFNDWGRDTMIALPGLTLATGRANDAAAILRAFAPHVKDGLLPNNFPDSAGQEPEYNTVDAALWYVLAVRAYHLATGDTELVDTVLPALLDIVDHYIAGTRYGIGVDPVDGLLRAGEPGVQLTWMDAKVGDWVITPRIGKPVEINALWYNALRTVAAFLADRRDPAAARYNDLADRLRLAFRARFRRADGAYLADVIDGPDGDDFTLRPNQIFAVSLPYPLLDNGEAAQVVTAVGRALLTSHGLRSLGPDHPEYRGDYGGDQLRRDSAYHQGPVWTWLMGAYAEAYARVYGKAEALALLKPFEHHLRDAGLGSISEILEGDAPHAPRGCVAQAWSVAEILRVWRNLAG